VTRLESERDQFRALYIQVMERCRVLELGLVSSKSDRLHGDDSQLSLSMLEMMLGRGASDRVPECAARVARGELSPHGVRYIPRQLP
jgi:hypothetical protein